MKKATATRFYQANVEGNLSRLVNVRRAMSDIKCDEFRFNRDLHEVSSASDLDFENCYCFIVSKSGKAYEVDSLDDARKYFANL